MARTRRDPQDRVPAVDFEWEFRWLRRLLMNTEPNSPGAAISARIRAEAAAIRGRGGSPADMLDDLWAFLDALGLNDAGERHLAHLRLARERRGSKVARDNANAPAPRKRPGAWQRRDEPPMRSAGYLRLTSAVPFGVTEPKGRRCRSTT